jgi:hypothetical protein
MTNAYTRRSKRGAPVDRAAASFPPAAASWGHTEAARAPGAPRRARSGRAGGMPRNGGASAAAPPPASDDRAPAGDAAASSLLSINVSDVAYCGSAEPQTAVALPCLTACRASAVRALPVQDVLARERRKHRLHRVLERRRLHVHRLVAGCFGASQSVCESAEGSLSSRSLRHPARIFSAGRVHRDVARGRAWSFSGGVCCAARGVARAAATVSALP